MKSSKNLFAVCTLALLGGALFSCEEPSTPSGPDPGPTPTRLDIAGEWTFSAVKNVVPNGNELDYTSGDVSVTIEYVEELGVFRFSQLPFEDQWLTDGAGLALRTDSDGNVYFFQFDKTGLYADGMGGRMTYRNIAYVYDKPAGLFPTPIENDTELKLEISEDGGIIKFPTTYTYEGTERPLACGFGYLTLGDGVEDGDEDEDGAIEFGTLYTQIVLTKK